MKEPKINVAHYTKLFKDISRENLLIIEGYSDEVHEIIDNLDYPAPINVNFYEIFYARYWFYEINDSDESVFMTCVDDVFHQYFQYYSEVIAGYYREFDYATANKRRVHRVDSGSTESSGSSSSSGSSENDTYGLPNKQVNNLKDGYLTDVEKGTTSDTTESSRSGESSLESDIVTTFDNEYLDLKRQFMRQIRDVLGEFVEKFSECFLHVYS